MTTAAHAMSIAAGELGTREASDGGTPYHDALGYPHSWAWCQIFASWVLLTAGVPFPSKGFSWVTDARDWLGRADTPGEVLTGTGDARPGDLCFFEWGTTPGGYDHVGMVEHVHTDTLTTIEGNTSDAVMRHTRSRYGGGIAELGRPAYTTDTPEDDDMQAKQLLLRDTRPGRHGATYLTTVFTNPPGVVPHEVGSGVGSLLADADQVGKLQRAGIQMLDITDDDPFGFLSLGVVPCAKNYPL